MASARKGRGVPTRDDGRCSLRTLLLADLARQWQAAERTGTPTSWADIVRGLGNLRFLPVVLYRLAWACGKRGWSIPARVLSFVNQVVFGVEIALRLEIGPGLYIPHSGGIVLGATRIGARATIYHGVTVGAAVLDTGYDPERRPTVGDDVVLAAGAKVLGGITVGDGALVGANAVVVDDAPPMTVLGGVPARVLRQREGRSW